MALTGNVATDLGLGGSLQQQVANETEEEKKRRLQKQMNPAQQMSPGALALLGPGMGLTSGGS